MPTAAEKIWTDKWVEYYLYLDSAVTHAIDENVVVQETRLLEDVGACNFQKIKHGIAEREAWVLIYTT